ncbi:MAG: VCBS repeat-containing protein, partial [Myxococcales bacterium]|nr:VCBS repeat-containing protein [Myxococcales bacterium]
GCNGGEVPTAPEPTDEPVDTDIPTLPPPPPPVDPCVGGVAIEAPAAVGAFRETVIGASGGVGPYRFEIAVDASGGAIEPSSGRWFPGGTPGVDTLRVTDVTCGTSAEADISVYAALVVHPEVATVPRGHQVSVVAEGGSGTFRCDPVDLPSGASLTSGCSYTSGLTEGVVDTFDFVDTATGVTTRVTMTVRDLPLVAVDTLLLPLGAPHTLELGAGSGTVELLPSAGLQLVDGVITASTPGPRIAEIVDTWTGQIGEVRIEAAAPRTLPGTRDGTLLDWGALTVADLDGDGRDDIVFGSPEASHDAWRSGGVYIYPGSPGGFVGPQTLSGTGREELFGRAVVTGDFDGDGTPELAVGSSQRSVDGPNRGGVTVFASVSGPYPLDPVWSAEGRFNGDQLGYAVAACDLDGDGYDDLIAGGPNIDDRGTVPTVGDSGGIQVWMGGPGGLGDPSVMVEWYGRRPELVGASWAWVEATNARAGSALATGDLDGDGGCDVAIGG